jgi:hypothetical protein
MNWSKRDLNLDKISTNPYVFNRWLTTVDPKMFSSQPELNTAELVAVNGKYLA